VSGTGELRSALAEALPSRPFAVSLWDGSVLPATNDNVPTHPPTFRLTSPSALGHVLRAPSQLGVGRAYVSGGIEVDDIDAALAFLKAKGIAPSWGPIRRPTYARAEIRDPDGNSIELRQWLER